MVAWAGVPADRVVAVVAELASGRTQWGSGFLVTGGRVLTAWHCTVDKESGVGPVSLSVFRKADGASAVVERIVGSRALDVAVLELGARPWVREWQLPKYGRVDRARAGVLEDCQAIGYPYFQADSADRQRNTAELHGDIRRTDEAESGFLLLRDRGLETVSTPDGESAHGGTNPWAGLSGALVFHAGYALGIVVERHPRQGTAAVRILPIDRIAAATAPEERSVAAALGLPGLAELPLLTGEPLDLMAEFLSAGSSASPLDALAGDPGAPGWNVTSRFLDAAMHGPGGELPFAGRDAEFAALDEWLASPAPTYHLVTGNPGTGKSTLLARWSARQVQSGMGPRVVLVPVSARYDANSGLDVFGALVHRLAKVHSVPYARSGDLKDYREKAAGLLARPAPDGSALLVVLDGLDEASDWEPGPQYFPARLGSGVRVLLSARQTGRRPTARAWLEALELDPERCATTELSALGPRALASLVEQVRGTAAPGNAELADRLLRITGGEPVVTALYLRDLAETPDADPGAWPGEMSSIGRGINGYLDRWLREQQRLWDARNARRVKRALRVLSLLALAEGPIEHAQLRLLAERVGPRMDGGEVSRALELLDRFVLPGVEQATVVLAHPLIQHARRDWLRDAGEYDDYARAYEAWGVDVLGRLRTGELAPGKTPVYLVRHLAQHLTAGADLHPAAVQLATPYWRRVKDAVSDETTGFQTDLETVMARARRLDAAQVGRGESPRHLPERVMCAAELAGNRQALTTSMTPALAAEFVRADLWRPQRALSYVDENCAGRSSRVDAVVAIAPVVPADQLPELNRLVRTALETTYHEEQAAVVAAWARRLFELGRAGDALGAASRLLTGNDPERRGFVEVWVLADLIPDFEDDPAAKALARAIDVLRETDGDLSYAACRLTQNVPVHRAEELWRAREKTRPAQALAAALHDRRARRPQSITSPDLTQDAMHFADQSRAFVAAARWLTDEERSAFIARGLELAPSTPGPWKSALEIWGSESKMNQFYLRGELRRALLPGINYDGLLSVLPAADAADACGWVRRVVSGHQLLGCLAQLLPLLDASRRRAVADELFEAPAEEFRGLDGDLNLVLAAAPAIVAAGLADRLVDRIRSDTDLRWLPLTLAPYLTGGQANTLLEALPGRSGQYHPRNAVLARWASFGRRQTIQAFDEAYAAGASNVIDPDVMRSLRVFLSGDRDDEPEAIKPLHAWWRHAYPGSYPDGGTAFYRRDPQVDAADIEAMLEDTEPDPAGYHVVDVAFALARRLTAKDVPRLFARAGTLADPWLALTLLAAGTHLSAGAAADSVTAEICARLDALRAASPEPLDLSYRYPHGSHWLARGFNGWAPFFARVVSPAARAPIADRMFAGGYLDGVVEHFAGQEDLDSWATDALGLTPLLTHQQLAWWEVIARHGFWSPEDDADAGSALQRKPARPPRPKPKEHIQSGTVRSYFYAGIAVGYAACGDLDDAYRLVGQIGGPHPLDLRRDVLAEILAMTGPGELPGWIAKVHATVGAGNRTGPLWAHLVHRLHELTDEQMWTIVDHWLAEVPKSVRSDVFGDAQLYRYAIARVAGKDECARLMALIEERESLNRPPRPDPREHAGPTTR